MNQEGNVLKIYSYLTLCSSTQEESSWQSVTSLWKENALYGGPFPGFLFGELGVNKSGTTCRYDLPWKWRTRGSFNPRVRMKGRSYAGFFTNLNTSRVTNIQVKFLSLICFSLFHQEAKKLFRFTWETRVVSTCMQPQKKIHSHGKF